MHQRKKSQYDAVGTENERRVEANSGDHSLDSSAYCYINRGTRLRDGFPLERVFEFAIA